MRPPGDVSTMRRTRESPRPQPRFLVVYPGLKTVLKRDLGMPFPVSVTSIQMCRLRRPVVMVIMPRPSMASTAFLVRFSMTHENSDSFICT